MHRLLVLTMSEKPASAQRYAGFGGTMKIPDVAEPVIGRRFAPTRWLIRAGAR